MDNKYLLFIMALVPIIWLMISLVGLKMKSHVTGIITVVLAIIFAVLFWHMSFKDAVSAAIEGALKAIWPIVWVIVAAVFNYNMSVKTGAMDTIKGILTNFSKDKRILMIMIAFSFGGFLEGIAGFGIAVAIPAAIMITCGFDALESAIICLLANTVPTAYGAVGTPVLALGGVTGLDANVLAYVIAMMLATLTVILPVFLVWYQERNWKRTVEVMPIALIAGLFFAVPQCLVARYIGYTIPAIIGGVFSIVAVIVATKILRKESVAQLAEHEKVSSKQAVIACSSFILMFVFIILASPIFPSVHNFLSMETSHFVIYTGAGAKATSFPWVNTAGSLIFVAAIIGGLIQGSNLNVMIKTFVETLKQMKYSAITIVEIVAIAKIYTHSGMTTSIATVLAMVTGTAYPIFAPVVGALGTFVTGSDTSSNMLFGGLQATMAHQLHMNPYWLASANTAGATAGKMISPSSIAIATAATGLMGRESDIMRRTLVICGIYLIAIAIIVYFGAPHAASLINIK